MKTLLFKQRSDRPHWVGDGFPVRTVFSYAQNARHLSPFLLLDHAGPTEFAPSKDHVRGVGEHPHRGFETVSIVYAGEVEHRDSSGGGGAIGPGDVQWMTAGAGLVHEEMHGRDFAQRGGAFEMVQLWVNLPARDKLTKPKYQEIRAAKIPHVELANGAGYARIIAGSFAGQRGPAETHTPIDVWDVRLKAAVSTKVILPAGHGASLFVLSGELALPEGSLVEAGAIAVFSRDGDALELMANADAKLLVLSGEPIDEPIAGYGPFVMNTPQEIEQALDDYRKGRMGRIDG